MNDFVISGLMKRRAELAGEIEATHERLRKLVTDLEALDATILQFDPSYSVETIAPKAFRPPKDWSNRGQMTRLILSILRQAKEPLTTCGPASLLSLCAEPFAPQRRPLTTGKVVCSPMPRGMEEVVQC